MDYEDQLEKALEESPDVADDGERFQVPDPRVRSEGSATVYENFDETCDRLARDPSHLMKALQSELGTSAQIDSKGRLRLTGDFSLRRMQVALDAYVDDYVLCGECDSPDTRLVTEQGTTVLKCDACGALSAVPDL